MNEQKRMPAAVVILSALVLLLLVYVGGYFANVRRGLHRFNEPGRFADYRVGLRWSDKVFAPIHALDRHVRRDYWEASDPNPENLSIIIGPGQRVEEQ
jgi:hypothetical protein